MKLLEPPECYFIHNVLTPSECEHFIKLSNELGYKTKKSKRSGPPVRTNERVLFEAPESTIRDLQNRLLPPLMDVDVSSVGPGWKLDTDGFFLNSKWRFNVYKEGQTFNPHLDSGHEFAPDHRSLLSVIIYLNDDFDGGETCFYPNGQSKDNMTPGHMDKDEVRIKPKQGSALIFPHYGPFNPRHSGMPVIPSPRPKYIIRTDIFYKDHQFSLEKVLFGGISNLKRLVILMGPPGAGKSTIVKALNEKTGWSGMNFGASVRDWGKTQSELGQKIRDHRKLVQGIDDPSIRKTKNWLADDLSIEILKKTFPKYTNQFLAFDGFPKMRSQALLLERSDWFIISVINLQISDKVQKERILKRAKIGDSGSDQVVMRSEDSLEGLEVRMVDWREDSLPLVEHFRKKGLVVDINAESSIETILEEIENSTNARLYDLAAAYFPQKLLEIIKGHSTDKKNLSKKSIVYRFSDGNGPDYYLKLVNESRFSNAETFEAPLLTRLKQMNFPLEVPEVLADFKLGPSINALLSRKVTGITLKEAFNKYPEAKLDLVKCWARALAKVHGFKPLDKSKFIIRSVPQLLSMARDRLGQGLVKKSSFSAKYGCSQEINLAVELEEIGSICDHLQFSEEYFVHGDPCAPNMIYNEQKKEVTGCIDNPGSGFSDYHWDLAIACWSVVYNSEESYRDIFLDEYFKTRNQHTHKSLSLNPDKFDVMYRLARFIL
jgi:adenylate kinase family enzyme/aminoglycoside phosphotransferase